MLGRFAQDRRLLIPYVAAEKDLETVRPDLDHGRTQNVAGVGVAEGQAMGFELRVVGDGLDKAQYAVNGPFLV